MVKLVGEAAEMSIDDLNKEKKRLIERYMKLQDVVDEYNEEIYKVCCQIEVLNQMIKVEEEKALQKKNGTHAAAPTQPKPNAS